MRHPDKQEAIRQWDADPCGLIDGYVPHDSAYWEQVDRERYRIELPWLAGLVKFDRFAGQRLLEVGCGLGTDLLRFAQHGALAVGVDLTPRHLALTQERFLLTGYPVTLMRSDAEDLAVSDQSVEGVYSFGVLHHTPDIAKAFFEIRRVLRPEGIFVVALYNRHSLQRWWKWLIDGIVHGHLANQGPRKFWASVERHTGTNTAEPLVRFYTRSELRALLHRAGFRDVAIRSRSAPSVLVHPGDDGLKRLAKRLLARMNGVSSLLARRFGFYLIAEAR